MKVFLLAAAFSTAVAAAALAEDNRDQAFGKHDMGPTTDSMHKSLSSSGTTQGVATGRPAAGVKTRHTKKSDR